MASQRYENTINFDATEDVQIVPPPRKEGNMPTIFHIGGLAKDCLTFGYKTGLWHFDCSTKTDRLTINTMGEIMPFMNSVAGQLELHKRYDNLTMGLCWSTDVLSTTATFSGQTRLGEIFNTLSTTYSNNINKLSANLQLCFERMPYRAELIVPLLKEPKLMGYFIIMPSPYWMFGYRTVYDLQKLKFDKHAVCVGFDNDTTEIGLKLENGKDFRGSLFQRVSASWTLALKWNYYSSKKPTYAIGWQYQINNITAIKAKLCDNGVVGFIYSTKLCDKIAVAYHISTNGKYPLCGEHKLGISWHLIG